MNRISKKWILWSATLLLCLGLSGCDLFDSDGGGGGGDDGGGDDQATVVHQEAPRHI